MIRWCLCGHLHYQRLDSHPHRSRYCRQSIPTRGLTRHGVRRNLFTHGAQASRSGRTAGGRRVGASDSIEKSLEVANETLGAPRPIHLEGSSFSAATTASPPAASPSARALRVQRRPAPRPRWWYKQDRHYGGCLHARRLCLTPRAMGRSVS
jgi:hypothetical protein